MSGVGVLGWPCESKARQGTSGKVGPNPRKVRYLRYLGTYLGKKVR